MNTGRLAIASVIINGFVLALVALALVACSSSGGGANNTPTPVIISGTVAAGTAVNGTVSVYDSSTNAQPRTASTAIGTGGQYSVTVTGFTAPFLIEATGQVGGQGPTVTMYAVATAAGTVNVTPITTLMALNMAAGNIQTLMSGSGGSLPSLTATDLNDQNTSMDTLLSPMLTAEGLSATYNFSTTSFTVGSPGYDRLLDNVTVVTTNPSAVTITNNTAPGSPVTIDTNDGSADGTLDITGGPTMLPIGTLGTVSVPNVVGDTGAAATTAITGAGLSVGTVTQQSSATMPAGDVISENPSANSGVATGSAVALVISTGPAVQIVADEWTWMGGANTVGATGVYGTMGLAAATSVPGSRDSAASWTDASGNFWLFGGENFNASTALTEIFSDVWEYSPTTGEWNWVSGSNAPCDNLSPCSNAASYGTQDAAAASNTPGVRYGATTWTDTSGNLWLFGGIGFEAGQENTGDFHSFGDLWKYNISSGEWTWVSGSTVGNASGIYGTQGTASSTDVPGARGFAVSWTDASGNFWLFGGVGNDSQGNFGELNDLWMFNPGTAQWTWMSGSNLSQSAGSYGTLGVASASNVPGARSAASGWIDSAGDLWLFGGAASWGISPPETNGDLNDLWKYNLATKQWTWVNGSGTPCNDYSTFCPAATYGAQGVASTSNMPGQRSDASAWVDSSGNLWLFGGDTGADSLGNEGMVNDLWVYSPNNAEWTWVSGSNLACNPSIVSYPQPSCSGVYGTIGSASASNAPPARQDSSAWRDPSGNLWLFGGDDNSGNPPFGDFNDLWQWTTQPSQ